MQGMAQYGRNGDTMMAHVAPGEMVVPSEILQKNPQVARGLGMAFADAGADPLRYTVGSGQNSINPVTGEPEFFLDKIIEYGSKLFGGGGGGSFFSNPIVQGAISNVALKAITGGKPSLRDALIGGVAGGGLGYLSGGDSGLGALFGMDADAPSAASKAVAGGRGNIFEKPGERKDYLQSLISDSEKPKYKRAEGLLGIGELFNMNPEEGLGRILNTKAGEAIAMGLGSQLLDSVFGKDDEETDADRAARRANQTYAEMMADPTRVRLAPVRRPRGTADQIMEYYEGIDSPDFLRLNKGGPTYFPRRDGGIMPSEGSGTKDDVPAMLTAGEFVMTRDAVKGAGNGNLDKGIQTMYSMMGKLEDRA